MSLPKELTTVTPVSKTIALIMFITLPIMAFLFGMNYQNTVNDYKNLITPTQKVCTEEAKICPDGSAVGRTGPNCEFTPCPTTPTGSISVESVCNKKLYESVMNCKGYFIAARPCCDQPSDILNNLGEVIATCGGLIAPNALPPQCVKYQQILKTIDQTNCLTIQCSTSQPPSLQ